MNINAMMAQAKKMQAEIEKKQKELDKKEFVIEKQGLIITIFGNRKIKSIEINEILVDPEDKETLEDLLIIGLNEANEVIDAATAELQPSTPGMPF